MMDRQGDPDFPARRAAREGEGYPTTKIALAPHGHDAHGEIEAIPIRYSHAWWVMLNEWSDREPDDGVSARGDRAAAIVVGALVLLGTVASIAALILSLV